MQSVHSDNSSNSSTEKATIESLTTELAEEKKRTFELDKELKLQISLKAESDMAMKLLEKDIHEKQDTIISLRRQLDDIKQINLEMYRKLQVGTSVFNLQKIFVCDNDYEYKKHHFKS